MNDLKENLIYIRKELEALYVADYTDEEREEREQNGEETNFFDYVANSLDIEYRVDSKGEYRGAYIWVTLGGPNIQIDTFSGYIKGAWGSDREEIWLPREIANEIDFVCEEYYNMGRM